MLSGQSLSLLASRFSVDSCFYSRKTLISPGWFIRKKILY